LLRERRGAWEAESALSNQDLGRRAELDRRPESAADVAVTDQVLLVSVEVEAPADLAVSDETAAGIVV
jgi:hypothetical protein